jgi:hypothetical protein
MKIKEKMITTLSYAILFPAITLILGCAKHTSTGAVTNGTPRTLENGIYAVLGDAPTPEQARVEGVQHIVLAFDKKKYSDVNQNEPPYYVAIDPCSYVPLVIEGMPETQPDGRGKSVLLVSLKEENAKKLEDFTRAHLGGRVATIVDGEMISLNKIRAVIADGKLQMTRCTDNACEIIRAKLIK